MPAWGGAAEPNVAHAGSFAPAMTPEQEAEGLKQQADYFQNALGEINKRIEQLEAENKK